MPRLFTGLRIPSEISQRLSLLQFGLSGARWIESSDFHITLRFFGDVDGSMADDIIGAYHSLSSQPFSLKLSGVGVFGRKKPRMVWAAVGANVTLSHLQMCQETLAQKIGLKAEGRKFTPHVTLARLKGSQSGEIVNYLSDHAGFVTPQFEVNEFVLYSAKDSRGGGPYAIEEIYPFEGAGD